MVACYSGSMSNNDNEQILTKTSLPPRPNRRNRLKPQLDDNSLVDLAKTFFNMGQQYANQNDWERAVIWFERAVSYCDDDVALRCVLAHAYESVNRLPEAIDTASELMMIGLEAQYKSEALAIIGRSCRQLGDLVGAVRAWTELLNISPGQPDAWRELSDAGAELVKRVGAEKACELILRRQNQLDRDAYTGVIDQRNTCPVCGTKIAG